MRIGQLFRKITWLGRLRACPDCTCRFPFLRPLGTGCAAPAVGQRLPLSTYLGLSTGPGLLYILLPRSTSSALLHSLERPACRSSHLMPSNHVPMKDTEKRHLGSSALLSRCPHLCPLLVEPEKKQKCSHLACLTATGMVGQCLPRFCVLQSVSFPDHGASFSKPTSQLWAPTCVY